MSTQNETPMAEHEAREILIQGAFVPAFFEKLAANGIHPQTEDEARTYLSVGQKLLVAHQHEQIKTAGATSDFLKEAEHQLDRVLAERYGGPAATPKPAVDPSIEAYVKAAADRLAANPLIQKAVEAYGAAA